MLGQIENSDEVVIADFEAGLGTLSRLKSVRVDVLLIVAEPTAKAVDVARRGLDMIQDRSLTTRVVVIGNRVSGRDDRAFLEGAFEGQALVLVPDDPAVRDAGLNGVAPSDASPDGPAVQAIRDFANTLTFDGSLR